MKSITPPSLMRWIHEWNNNTIQFLDDKINIGTNREIGFTPYDVKIKITLTCNAKCYYCLHGIKTHTEPTELSKNELSVFEWKNILIELKELGTRSVHFSGGEPTLRTDLPELIKFCTKKLGLRAKMTSNGSLITPELAHKLAESKLKTINISLDGIGKFHDKVRGNGMFEKTWNGIIALANASKIFKRPQIRINHVITSENYHNLSNFLTFLDESEVNIAAIHLLFVDFQYNLPSLALNHKAVREIVDQYHYMKNIIKLDIREGNLVLNPDQISEHYIKGEYAPEALTLPCFFPYIHMFILPNGDVNICCGAERKSKLMLGNLRKTSAYDIWNGEGYKKLRKFLLKDKFEFCVTCDHGIVINKAIYNKIQKVSFSK
ncbi:MAG: radical SAM/SPASM domain-containing protein [Candidatus Hodarchaeales archaeon]|jgi:MoaA/NifB/PqqE/SkfB family radical SAM enzyme